MTKDPIFYRKNITKDEISQLQVEEFEGRIIVITSEQDALKAIDYLSSFESIGFDTETRPSFIKGKRYQVSLMQLSTEDTCFLFRLNIIGLSDKLADFLADDSVKKIGLSIRDDFSSLSKRRLINPKNFVDLQTLVKKFGIEDMSLQKIYALLFNKKISKGQRLTNWEAEILTEPQKKYASLDAWACLKIYNYLNNIQDELLQDISEA